MPKSERPAAPRQPGYTRGLIGFLGALALLLQLLAPTFSSASEAEWIEICSEMGPVLVQVDAQTGEPVQEDCPECSTCLMCALGESLEMRGPLAAEIPVTLALNTATVAAPFLLESAARLWPAGRGPPLGLQHITCRVPSDVTIKAGGGPWA